MIRPHPINRRADLLAIVREYAPSRACQRSIDHDHVTILGGFTPAGGLPRWVVRVESPHGRVWHIAVLADKAQFRIEYPESVNWADWAGNPDRRHPVYDGDHPIQNAAKRLEAQHGLQD